MAQTIIPFSNLNPKSQDLPPNTDDDELKKFRETLKKTLSSNSLTKQKDSYIKLQNRAISLQDNDSSCAVIAAIAILPISFLVASYFK